MRYLRLTLLACSPLAACSDSRPQAPQPGPPAPVAAFASPDAAVEGFLSELAAGEAEAAQAFLTPSAAQALAAGDGLGFDAEGVESVEFGVTSVEGDRARTLCTIIEGGSEQSVQVLTRREAERWGVWGVELPIGDGFLTLDFERPDGALGGLLEEVAEGLGEALAEGMAEAFEEAERTWEQGGTPEEIAAERLAFEAVEPIDAAQVEAAGMIDVEGAGRPARAVLAEVLTESGLEFVAELDALDQPVDLQLTGVSRVEAVERIAGAVGVHPIWPAAEAQVWDAAEARPEPLTFAAGPRPRPATFAGPFLIEASEVVEHAPRPTGELTVTARALGLPPAAVAFAAPMSELVALETVRGPAGQVLVDDSTTYYGSPAVRGSYLTYSTSRDLTGLLRSVEAIDAVVGEVRLELPSAVEAVRLTAPGPSSAETSWGALTIEEWGADTRVELDGEGVAALRLLASPRAVGDGLLGVRSWNAYSWGQGLEGSLECPAAPAAIDVKVCASETLTFAFELAAIPLPDFQSRPVAIAALEFSGVAPLALNMAGPLHFENGMAEVQLTLTNGSNKDINSAMVEFSYRDGAGQHLESFPHTLNGDWDFDLAGAAPLAAVGATVERTSHAAFAPPETEQIHFAALSVEFTDGTGWLRD